MGKGFFVRRGEGRNKLHALILPERKMFDYICTITWLSHSGGSLQLRRLELTVGGLCFGLGRSKFCSAFGATQMSTYHIREQWSQAYKEYTPHGSFDFPQKFSPSHGLGVAQHTKPIS